MVAPSGRQHQIQWAGQRATIVEVGGGIREYTDEDSAVLDGYPVNVMCDGAHGTPLIPWPNRLGGGCYSFAGREHRLPLTEPERGNAIHGLLRWRNWTATDGDSDRIVMATELYPSPGYPFALHVEVQYQLSKAGLTVSMTAENMGSEVCPYACGQHPYLSPGDGLLDACALQIGAAARWVTDETRQLPIHIEPVAHTPYDFRRSRALGAFALDTGFTDLIRDSEGRAWARLHRPDGRVVELWVDETFSVLQVYTGDTLDPERRRHGIAVEPMSAPADAFRSGVGVTHLAPGQRATMRWGVHLATASSR